MLVNNDFKKVKEFVIFVFVRFFKNLMVNYFNSLILLSENKYDEVYSVIFLVDIYGIDMFFVLLMKGFLEFNF